jgi:hypothetical protein
MAIDRPVGHQSDSVQDESDNNRPLRNALQRAAFIYERQNRMDCGNQIRRYDC